MQDWIVRVPCSLTFLFKAPTMLLGAWANHRESLCGKRLGPLVPSSGWVHKSIPSPTFNKFGSPSWKWLLWLPVKPPDPAGNYTTHEITMCFAEPHWEYRLYAREAYGLLPYILEAVCFAITSIQVTAKAIPSPHCVGCAVVMVTPVQKERKQDGCLLDTRPDVIFYLIWSL